MSEKPVLNDIDSTVKLGKYIFDETQDYELNEDCQWIKALFDELEEETDRNEPDYKKGFFECDLSLKRKSGKPFADHLLIKGHLATQYQTPCVRCLTLTQQNVETDFQVAFVPSHLEKEPEFEELDDIFTENEEYNLYYHQRGNVDVAEMVHEMLYMNVDPFPLHDEDCLGLCHTCGANLNEGLCEHQQKQ